MKFKVDKVSFLKVLDRCRGATDTKGPMPILSHVLLRADADTIMGCVWVSATNLFIGVTNNVHASVDEDGSIALSARDLYDRIKLMPEGDVSISAEGTAVTLKSCVKGSARRYKMQGLPSAEFPTIPDLPLKPELQLLTDATSLASGLEQSTYASSHDESRAHLNSVLLEREGSSVAFVSTDGHRMALSRVSVDDNGTDGKDQLVVPLRAAKEILKLAYECAAIKNIDQNVAVYKDGPNLFVSINGFRFSAKLVSDSFPPYQQIIPEKSANSVDVDRRALIEGLKAIAISSGDNGGVKFTFSKDKLSLSSESTKGDGADELECSWTGAEKSYGFNAKYMIEALESIDSDFVSLGLSDELDPAIITQKGDNTDQLAIVMPMRI